MSGSEQLRKKNIFVMLGITPTGDFKADQPVIKKAYRALALKIHPDKNAS